MVKHKKTLLVLFLLLSSTLALAQQTTSADNSNSLELSVPGDFAYPFKRLFEGLQLFFAFDAKQKAVLSLQFAQRRIDESSALAKMNKSNKAAELVVEHNKLLMRAETLKNSLNSTAAKSEVEKRIHILLQNREKNFNQLKSTSQTLKTAVSKVSTPKIVPTASIASVGLDVFANENYSQTLIAQAKNYCLNNGGTWHFGTAFVGCENGKFPVETCEVPQVKQALKDCEFFEGQSACSAQNVWCRR